MSVEELKSAIMNLSDRERSEVAAFLFHLRHRSDSEYQSIVAERLDDKDLGHWLSPDEFDKRIGEN